MRSIEEYHNEVFHDCKNDLERAAKSFWLLERTFARMKQEMSLYEEQMMLLSIYIGRHTSGWNPTKFELDFLDKLREQTDEEKLENENRFRSLMGMERK